MIRHGDALAAVVIAPTRGWAALRLRELWEYRELLYFLIWRDVKVRYKQTIIGVAWAVVQPVCTMVVFSLFFGRLVGVPSDGLPYPVFVFCALLPWQLFGHGLTESGNSLVASERLITKVYFPRLMIPLAAVLGGLVDFAVAFGVLLILMAYYGIVPTVGVVFLPALVGLTLMAALAVGLWLSVLNVQYRDVRYTLPFLTQLWLFATPIAYPASLLSSSSRSLLGLNPMAGVVESFRWALLGTQSGIGSLFVVSCLVTGLLLLGGLFYFRRTERTFADVI